MDGLPLALDQAAAYMEEMQISAEEYLGYYITGSAQEFVRDPGFAGFL